MDPHRHSDPRDPRRMGFSLVELVVVMIVSGIVAGTVGIFLSRPMEGYQDLSRRAALVDAADLAARRMARDVHRALPNSIRVATAGGRTALELLHTVDGARYRAVPGVNGGGQDHTADTDVLSFFGDDRWNVLGRLRGASFAYGTPLPAGTRVAIYTTQTGLTWADAAGAGGPALLTPAGTAVTVLDDGDEDQIVLSASHRFRFASPGRRLYLVDGPVTYLCDPAAETLSRVAGYAPAAGQPTDPAVAPLAGGASAVVTDRVATCVFTWQPGAPSQRSGLLTVDLTLVDEGETVRLLRQVHVANVP